MRRVRRSSAIASWPTIRYERLFPLAKHGPAAARLCGIVAGAVEYLIDPVRRDVAVRRIARAVRVSPRKARSIFRAALTSEAFEEAELVFLMARDRALDGLLATGTDDQRHDPGTIYVTFHLGHPVLAYLYLARRRGLPISILARALTEDNPMSEAKRRYGCARNAWIAASSRPFLHGDAESVVRARDMLLAGESIFVPIDVPGDVMARTADIQVFGERARFSSGVITLARLSRAPVQPVVALVGARGLELHWGRRIAPGKDAETSAAVFAELLEIVRRFPGEWWMWPYLATSG